MVDVKYDGGYFSEEGGGDSGLSARAAAVQKILLRSRLSRMSRMDP